MDLGVSISRLVLTCISVLLLVTSSSQSTNTTDSPTSATTTTTTASPSTASSTSTPLAAAAVATTTTTTASPSATSSLTSTIQWAVPTPTVVPCIANATTNCGASFSKYFMSSANISLDESQAAAFCNYPVEQSSCAGSVTVTCNTSTVDNSSSSSAYLYGLMCSSNGTLKVYWVNDTNCALAGPLNRTMSVLCGIPGNKLNCSRSSNGFYSASRATLVKQIQTSTCIVKPTTPTPLPLLPNPVGPAAITAIVVLVCLFITAVLAGFFFWPKCHIADPAAHLVKKATKPASASAAAANSASRPAADAQSPASVAYDARNNAATVKLPPTHGPSAA